MRKIALISVLLLIAIAVIPASAARALDIVIEVHPATIDPDAEDSFTATGSAVDDGLMCADGISSTERVLIKGPENPRTRLLRVIKLFVCNDSSGSIRVRLDVELDVATGDTSGDWSILDGTGDYANIEGKGSLVGVPVVIGESIDDTYIGRLRVENGQEPTCVDDRYEPNNSYETARFFAMIWYNQLRSDSGSVCENSDWFKVTFIDQGFCQFPPYTRDHFSLPISLSFDHAEGDLLLEVWDAQKQLIDSSNGTTDDERLIIEWTGNRADDDTRDLFVHVAGVRGASNDYVLTVGLAIESCS